MIQKLKEILSKNFKDIREIAPLDEPTTGYRWAASGGIEWEGEKLLLSVWVHETDRTRVFNIEKLGPFKVNPVSNH